MFVPADFGEDGFEASSLAWKVVITMNLYIAVGSCPDCMRPMIGYRKVDRPLTFEQQRSVVFLVRCHFAPCGYSTAVEGSGVAVLEMLWAESRPTPDLTDHRGVHQQVHCDNSQPKSVGRAMGMPLSSPDVGKMRQRESTEVARMRLQAKPLTPTCDRS